MWEPQPLATLRASTACAGITLPYLISLRLYSPLLDLGHFFSFLILYTVGRTPWTGDQPTARPLPTHRTTQTQNKRTQTFMHWLGFDPTIPVFKRAKTVHTLDRTATVIGRIISYMKIKINLSYIYVKSCSLTYFILIICFIMALP
jgi:hypothetical protein